MDVVGSQTDFSKEPRFVEARSGKTYFSPVYFRKESEPYITIAMAGRGQDAGVTVADVNLKFIWDVVSQIKIGKAGHAYVVDSGGNLIAHPDISLVLQKTNLSSLPQVRDALAGPPRPGEGRDEVTIARDIPGRQILTAHAAIAPLGWLVFVEQPLGEAFAPLYASVYRTVLLLVMGVGISVFASVFLARRMVTPIQALQAGAARIGAGDLGPSACGPDRGRGGSSGRPVQQHGHAASGVLREPGAEGRGADPGPHRGARTADRHQRDPPDYQ